MGMTLTITYPGAAPLWSVIRERSLPFTGPMQLRMIDGLPAFPDEQPEEGWRELRLSVSGSMLTLRRGAQDECIIWGNADAALQRAWQAIAYACADAGNGLIPTEQGPRTASEFALECSLTPSG